MPEGPEVKLIVDKLSKKLKNKTLTKIVVHNGKYTRFTNQFNNIINLLPLKIFNIDCKGKFIYFEFYDNDVVIFNTLGMSGSWFSSNEANKFSDNSRYSKKHNNIEFVFNNDISYYFNDMRNFGNIIISNKSELNKKLNKLGIDILEPNNEFNEFYQLLTKKSNLNKEIGLVLLDQMIVAGCGNYIRAEVLYLCDINPFVKINKLSDENIKDIYKYLKKVAYISYNIELGIEYGILRKNDKLIKMYENRMFLIYMQKIGPFGEIVKSKKMADRTIHYV